MNLQERADKIQQHFFGNGATVTRADFDFVLEELEKSYQEGAAAEREKIARLINSTANDMQKLELVVNYLNTPTNTV